MPFRPAVTFDSCTARLGNAELAPTQPVTLTADGGRMLGVLGVPAGSRVPAADEAVQLFIPGHGRATIRVTGTVPGEPSSVRLRFAVAWMPPELRATCSGTVAA